MAIVVALLLLFIITLLSSWAGSHAQAQERGLPTYNPHNYCGATLESDRDAFLKCMEDEARGYIALKMRWEFIPLVIQKHCEQMTSVGPGTYWGLLGCVQAELEAQGERM